MSDESSRDALLIEADSLLSLIRYRESSGLSDQTMADLTRLLPKAAPLHRLDRATSGKPTELIPDASLPPAGGSLRSPQRRARCDSVRHRRGNSG